MSGMRMKRPGKGSEKLVKKEKTARERTQELVRNAIRKKARKPTKAVRHVVLNVSAWSTEKKYMERHERTYDMFSGIEHSLTKKEMEEKFNKKTKQRWRFAADAARIADESAGSEGCKRRQERRSPQICFWKRTKNRTGKDECQRRSAGFCRVSLVFIRMDTEE